MRRMREPLQAQGTKISRAGFRESDAERKSAVYGVSNNFDKRRNAMHGIIYIIGLIVVVLAILSFLGLA